MRSQWINRIISFNHSHAHANDSNSPRLHNYSNTTICNCLEHTELIIDFCHIGGTSRAASLRSPHYEDDDSWRRPKTCPSFPWRMQMNDIRTVDIASRRLDYSSTDRPATGGTLRMLGRHVCSLRILPDEWLDSKHPRDLLGPPADLTSWILIGWLPQVPLRDWSSRSHHFVPKVVIDNVRADDGKCQKSGYYDNRVIIFVWFSTAPNIPLIITYLPKFRMKWRMHEKWRNVSIKICFQYMILPLKKMSELWLSSSQIYVAHHSQIWSYTSHDHMIVELSIQFQICLQMLYNGRVIQKLSRNKIQVLVMSPVTWLTQTIYQIFMHSIYIQ